MTKQDRHAILSLFWHRTRGQYVPLTGSEIREKTGANDFHLMRLIIKRGLARREYSARDYASLYEITPEGIEVHKAGIASPRVAAIEAAKEESKLPAAPKVIPALSAAFSKPQAMTPKLEAELARRMMASAAIYTKATGGRQGAFPELSPQQLQRFRTMDRIKGMTVEQIEKELGVRRYMAVEYYREARGA